MFQVTILKFMYPPCFLYTMLRQVYSQICGSVNTGFDDRARLPLHAFHSILTLVTCATIFLCVTVFLARPQRYFALATFPSGANDPCCTQHPVSSSLPLAARRRSSP